MACSGKSDLLFKSYDFPSAVADAGARLRKACANERAS
jgi:hypothetical protein